jgi:hypothetical protein
MFNPPILGVFLILLLPLEALGNLSIPGGS